jgi:hypothetical protein
VPPPPVPLAEINTSVPSEVNENQISSVAVAVQHGGNPYALAVDPTLVKKAFPEQ